MEKSNGHMIFNHFKDRNRINLPHHTRRKSQQFIKSILNHTITVSILTRVVGRSFARNTSHCGNCLRGFCSTAEQCWWSQAAHVPTRCCQAGNSADYKERQSPVDTWHYLVFALWIYIRINICCKNSENFKFIAEAMEADAHIFCHYIILQINQQNFPLPSSP